MYVHFQQFFFFSNPLKQADQQMQLTPRLYKANKKATIAGRKRRTNKKATIRSW